MKKIKLKIYYSRDAVDKPIMYDLMKKYDVQFNILHADINYGSNGTLVAEFMGKEENVKNAFEYMNSIGVNYKVYTKSIIRDEDECMDCGACTAVCPSDALTMDGAKLVFDKDKCLVCQLCIKACPLRIISVEM